MSRAFAVAWLIFLGMIIALILVAAFIESPVGTLIVLVSIFSIVITGWALSKL